MKKPFVVIVVVFILTRVYQASPPQDFVEYWAAGRAFLDGRNPYDANVLLEIEKEVGWRGDRALMMWNPPWTLAVALPFAMLPFVWAKLSWHICAALILLASAGYFWRLYGGRKENSWISWITPILFLPTLETFYLGQISVLLLGGIVGFHFFQSKKRDVLAGTSLFLCTVKPHLLLLWWFVMLCWVAKSRRYTVILIAGALPCLVLAGLWLERPSLFFDYWTAVTSEGPLVWLTPTLGTLLRLVVDRAWAQFLPVVAGLFATGWLWFRKWGPSFSWDEHLNGVLLLSVVFAGFGWSFDAAVLLPVVVQLVATGFNERRSWLLFWLAAIQVGSVAVKAATRNDFYLFWLPISISLVFLFSARKAPVIGAPTPSGPESEALRRDG